MGVAYLSIELTLDLIAFIIGCTIIIQAKDNYQKKYWGFISACIGLVFMWENIGWMIKVTDNPSFRYMELLSIEKMLKWYLPASIVSLFPIASLRPGFLTPVKVLSLLLFPIMMVTIGVCYYLFNGYFTGITSVSDLLVNLDRLDIKVRLFIFSMTIITPLLLVIYPLTKKYYYRKINRMMYLFYIYMFIFLAVYVLFTLYINEFIFNMFGATAIIFTLTFSVAYMMSENPFSIYKIENLEINNTQTVNYDTNDEKYISPLFSLIDTALRDEKSFTDKDYCIKDLSLRMKEKEVIISDAIKSAGYTSFKEYICDLRLDYFKEQLENNPDKNVKELMFSSGFNSRATFYRHFTKRYGVSPLNYFNKNSIN
ncbi:MAG: helix-turn-helix domain-containing protein [Parabacteroides sp.]|nr:helix-turn-helix domain-containing protein [Parabacteroides sp.]